ncbi:MAG TPA: PIG-L family deacetylase [Chthoniobacterales bacterium]
MHPLVPGDPAPPPAPAFTRDSRLMLIAPHPDDESLACGVILQAAVRCGAAVRVVYATDVENNPWPQRFMERKWRIHPADRRRWGQLRRKEAEAALLALGVEAESACFLGLPDQGLTDLLLHEPASLAATFSGLIDDFNPTDLIFPSTMDAHPDHNALAVLHHLLLRDRASEAAAVAGWQFAVHGQNPIFLKNAGPFGASAAETAFKVKAIECHVSQLLLSRKRFLRYAERPERFLAFDPAALPGSNDSLQILSRQESGLVVRLSPQEHFFDREVILIALGHSEDGEFTSTALRSSPRSSRTSWQITLPTGEIFAPERPIFLKLCRRSLGFADKGWCEAAALVRPEAVADASHNGVALHESLQGA